MTSVPGVSWATSSGPGLSTHATHSVSATALASTSSAPASEYSASRNPAVSPAPRSTRISNPEAASFEAVSGTSATRRSPGAVSFGTETSHAEKTL